MKEVVEVGNWQICWHLTGVGDGKFRKGFRPALKEVLIFS